MSETDVAVKSNGHVPQAEAAAPALAQPIVLDTDALLKRLESDRDSLNGRIAQMTGELERAKADRDALNGRILMLMDLKQAGGAKWVPLPADLPKE